jgi:cobalt-zinc-cadmium efflux system outer membrane protein
MGACLLVALVLCSPARAQERAAVTQQEALSLADQRAPDLLVSLAQADVARKDVDVASMLSNPRISAGASVEYTLIATFYMWLPIFGQRRTAEQAAIAQSKVAEASVEVVRLDARLAASLFWIDLWAAVRETALAEEEAARYDRVLAAAQASVKDGSAPELDQIRAGADASRAHSEVSALAATQVAASARLAALVGESSDAGLLAPSGEPDAGEPPSDAALDRYMSSHPLASRARAVVASADAAVKRERRARWPQLGVSVQEWLFRKPQVWAFLGGRNEIRGIATIDLPIFDKPRVARAQAVSQEAQASANAEDAHLWANAIAARADYVAARRRCEALSGDVVPAARVAADRTEQAYVDGELDLATAQGALQARFDAERMQLACEADRARTWAQLEHALGDARDE